MLFSFHFCAAYSPRNQVGMIQTRHVSGLCSVAVCETGSDLLLFPEGTGYPQQRCHYNNSPLSQLLRSLSFCGWHLKRALSLDVFPKVLNTKLEKIYFCNRIKPSSG